MSLAFGQLDINTAVALGADQTNFFIAGGTTLDNSSGGTVTIARSYAQTWNGDFTYAGSNALNLGPGAVSLGTTAGTARTVTVNGGNTTGLTVGGVISNGATATGLTKSGTGTLILTGANAYTGTTTISAGVLQVGASGTVGSLSASSAIVNNGTLTFNRSNAITQGTDFAIGITGSGALIQAGTGTLTLSGSNGYTGRTALNAGTINFANNSIGTSGTVSFAGGTLQYASGNTQDISSRIAGSTGAIAIDSNGNDLTYASNIGNTNTGGLTKTGLGMLILSGSNTYTGATTVNGGGISVSNSFWSGSGSALTLNSGTFRTTGAVTMNTSAPLPHVVTVGAGGGVFDVNGGLLNIGSGIAGTGSVTKMGSGTMQIGSSSFTGTLNLNAGTLQVVAANRFSSAAAVVFNGGGLTLDNSGVGAQTSSNAIILNTGGTIRALGGPSEAWTLSGNIGGTGSLTSSGSGRLVLSGSNTYTGATSVTAGTLLINGSLNSSSAVTVSSGATIGGSGTIGGSLSVNSGGTLAPGNSPGILNTGNLTLAGTLAEQLGKAASGSQPIAGTDYDQTVVTGSVTLTGGDLNLSILTGIETGDIYYIIVNDASDGVTGIFATLNGSIADLSQGATFTSGGQIFQISYTADSVSNQFAGAGNDVALLAVPEPATYLFLGLGIMAILWRARRRHVRE